MFLFTLRKVVSRLLFPTSAVVIVLVVGVLLLVIGRRRASRRPGAAVQSGLRRDGQRIGAVGLALVCAATGGLWLASLNPVADAFLWSLEGRYEPLLEHGLAAATAGDIFIVVLGAGHHERDGHGATHSLSRAARARVVEGVRLARLLPEARLIFTGGVIGGERAIAEVAAAAATELGLNPRRGKRLTQPLDTAAEARAVAQALTVARPAPGPGRAVILVTSASHMHRALGEFRAAGIEATPAPAEYRAAGRSDSPWSLLPSAGALDKFERAAYEYLGLLAMRLAGR